METSVWDTTQCHKAARITPLCEQAIQIAFDLPSLENRLKAQAVCDQLEMFDMNGWTREDTTKRVSGWSWAEEIMIVAAKREAGEGHSCGLCLAD